MSLTATAHSDGALRQDVLIDGRHRIITDEPERLGGTDAGPAPHELLPAALAACIGVTLAKYADTKGWDLGDIDVDVVYDNRATPRVFDVALRVSRPLSEEQVRRLDKVAAACPVRRSLEGGFEFHEQLEAGPHRRVT